MDDLKLSVWTCKTCGRASEDINVNPHSFDGWAGNAAGEHRCPECLDRDFPLPANEFHKVKELCIEPQRKLFLNRKYVA